MPTELVIINKSEPKVNEQVKGGIVETIKSIVAYLLSPLFMAISIHQGPDVEGKGKGGRIVNPPEEATETEEEATETEEQAKEQATAIRPTITEEPKENVNYWLE